MSALGDLAGAAVGGIWKIAALVLAGLLLVGGAAGGTALWMVTGARDKALADLDASRLLVAGLRAGVDVQNARIVELGKEALAAEARGKASKQLAAANARRFDGALERMAGARATTCAEAMPAVNQLLKDLK